jgi:hydroxyacylglutathione hydrolase
MLLTTSLSLVGSLQFGISGPLDCHIYAVSGRHGVTLIDAGGGTHTDKVLANLEEDFQTSEVAAVLVTHVHADHAAGAATFRHLTGCRVFAPEISRAILETGDEEAAGLDRARKQGLYPPDFHLSPCPVDRGLKDGEEVDVAGLHFKAIHVRGHSEDSLSYLLDLHGQRYLFAGDTVFYGGVLGVINAEGSGMGGYRQDLSKLAGLAIDGLLPGHGLFTLRDGQRHIDCALEQTRRAFVPRQIGQGDLIF